ncbi:MAG: glycosyl hydrolase family 79 C-terminal domain-containing protein, partial [Solirubrobacteraceae bacterium]
VTRATALALRAHLILGINLEADSAIVARAEARALERGIGRSLIAGFELGNEPEVYGTFGWYTTHARVRVPGRLASYDFGSYLTDYAAISSRLPRRVSLVGPASGSPTWTTQLNRYLVANPRVRIVTFHRYPLHRCFTEPHAPTYPTIPNLLARRSATAPAVSLQAAARVAHAHGLALRADELNSVSCGGAHGVSDRFASALWVLDTLFNMAAVGVDGVNIHTFNKALYAPFSFTHSRGAWRAHVAPMYYGMLMFARAAPTGSRLLVTRPASSRALRIWAVRAPDGTIRVTAINDSATRTQVLAVRPPQASGAATLERLTAPTLESGTGVTITGQTFDAATTTGELTHSYKTTTLQPLQHRYVVELPPASAALLSVRPS